ncbi:MAG: sulfatase, partial [Myxococcota bacterium]|nr:sulfatase [Myxococcota bacterium]
KPVSAGKFVPYLVDLSSHVGKLVRLEVRVEGPAGARIALSDLSLRSAPPKIEASSRKAKNAIVLLIDTLRADRLSAYGKTRVKSPVFDKLAGESTVFDNCQAVSNWTKPSCATVLTGMHPDSHKTRGHASVLGKSVKMASDIYRGAGFATGAFIANGYLATEFGFNRGWNQYVNFIRENKNSQAESVFKTALEFIAANKDKPFFTYIQTIDPHVPYDPPDEDLKIYDANPYEGPVANRSTGNLLENIKRGRVTMQPRDKQRLIALYDGEVTYHDRHLGHFLDALSKLGVLDDTVILITADHGEEFFEHDSVGHGHTLYQELIHVPLALRAPGIVPAGKRIETPVSLTDVLPTVLEATGVEVPKHVEGRSLIQEAQGEVPSPFQASFSSFFSEADDRNLQWAALKGGFKLRMKGPASTYLHNLAQDPREKDDVDTLYPIALRALRILHGQFVGAPDKLAWLSDQIGAQVVGGNKAEEEKAEVPDDLKAQLKALGYMQ